MKKDKLYTMYYYTGMRNHVKVQGFQKASTRDELSIRLEKQDISVLSAKVLWHLDGGIKPKEVILFANQMSSMIKNGISSTQAIDMYAQYANEDFKYILYGVLKSLKQGNSLANAFRKCGFFSALFCETIAMGEASANLDKSFENIKNFYERELYVSKKVKSMLSYPCIVGVVTMIVTIVMTIFILPKFGEVYADMGAELPLITELYIRIGQFIVSTWWLAILGFFGLLKIFKIYKVGTLHRKNIDRFCLDIPLVGTIYSKILVARFSNVLSLYLKSGIQIQNAILSSARVLQNQSIYDEFLKGTKSLMQGKSFYEISDGITIFPPFYKQVVYTGEKSGDLANSLVKLAETMDDEAKETLENSSANINQGIIVLLFILLAPTIIAIVLPVFNLTSVASQAGGL